MITIFRVHYENQNWKSGILVYCHKSLIKFCSEIKEPYLRNGFVETAL